MFHLALDNRGQMEDGGGLGGAGIRCQHGLLILDIYKHHNIAIHGAQSAHTRHTAHRGHHRYTLMDPRTEDRGDE